MSRKWTTFGSFRFAFQGFKAAFKNEPNFRFHLIAGIVALTMGFVFEINTLEWLFLFLSVSLVITTELINTAIEKFVDLVSPDYSEKAKIIKDVSAAAVLTISIFSILSGLIIFIPYIIKTIFTYI